MTEVATATFVQSQESGATPPPAAAPADRPAWLPENFKTAEDFAKSYGEQRAELTKAQQALANQKIVDPAAKPVVDPAAKPVVDPAAKPEDKPVVDPAKKLEIDPKNPNAATEKAAADLVAKSGADMTTYTKEWETTGDVVPENRAKIAEALKGSFPEGTDVAEIVNNYIDGQKARAGNYNAEVIKMAGGEEMSQKMMAWAKANYEPAEKEAFNKATNSGDLVAAKMAVEGLRGRYEREFGSDPALLTGENGILGASTAYASTYEMTKAMGDPRYKSDPVYRKSVEQRAMKSNF